MSFKNVSLISGSLCFIKLAAVLVVPIVIVLSSQTSNGQEPVSPALVAGMQSEVQKPEGYKPPRRGVPSRREGAGTR